MSINTENHGMSLLEFLLTLLFRISFVLTLSCVSRVGDGAGRFQTRASYYLDNNSEKQKHCVRNEECLFYIVS